MLLSCYYSKAVPLRSVEASKYAIVNVSVPISACSKVSVSIIELHSMIILFSISIFLEIYFFQKIHSFGCVNALSSKRSNIAFTSDSIFITAYYYEDIKRLYLKSLTRQMKFHDTHFEDYLTSSDNVLLHPKLEKIYETFPHNIGELRNIIFYGPCGVGKYTQALRVLRKYSPSHLKYEKKVTDFSSKSQQIIKISDIHFEVDMSLLGCNSKNTWNDIYAHIVNVISTSKSKSGVILCKYFHEIHSELLECFNNYMQKSVGTSIHINFIFLTEHISFIPDNIVRRCNIIKVPRPSRTQYIKCLTTKQIRDVNIVNITNMKNINVSVGKQYTIICDQLLESILDLELFKFVEIRELLYDILIYNLNVSECIWYILERIMPAIPVNDFGDVVNRTFQFLQLYNNNYRPIYHLENFVVYLVNKVHGFTTDGSSTSK